MSEIKAGDMVMAVRGVCCDAAAERWLGRPFTVNAILTGEGICNVCGDSLPSANFATTGERNELGVIGVPISWLIKIDPPSDMLLEEQEKELTT